VVIRSAIYWRRLAREFLLPHWEAADVLDRRAAGASGAVYKPKCRSPKHGSNTARLYREVYATVAGQWPRFLYLVLLMTFMMFCRMEHRICIRTFWERCTDFRNRSREYRMIYNVGAVVERFVRPFVASGWTGKEARGAGAFNAGDTGLGLQRLVDHAGVGAFVMHDAAGSVGRDPCSLNELSRIRARGLDPG